MGSLKVRAGEWEKRYQLDPRETQRTLIVNVPPYEFKTRGSTFPTQGSLNVHDRAWVIGSAVLRDKLLAGTSAPLPSSSGTRQPDACCSCPASLYACISPASMTEAHKELRQDCLQHLARRPDDLRTRSKLLLRVIQRQPDAGGCRAS